MNYEITNVLKPETDNWQHQKKRLEQNGGQVITLAPDPNFYAKIQQAGVDGINVIDYVTQRTYDADSNLFFNRIPTVDGSEIFMNSDGSISIISDGEEIGSVQLYNGTRRLVQSVTYYNADKSRNFVEEYTSDGQLFSRLAYRDDEVFHIAFFNNQNQVALRFYRYEGQINLITVMDPESQKVIASYNNLVDFYRYEVGEIVTDDDQVGISYLGIELQVLAATQSTNTLYLEESPVDDNGLLRGNLQGIIDGQIDTVQRIAVTDEAYDLLSTIPIPVDMTRIIHQ